MLAARGAKVVGKLTWLEIFHVVGGEPGVGGICRTVYQSVLSIAP